LVLPLGDVAQRWNALVKPVQRSVDRRHFIGDAGIAAMQVTDIAGLQFVGGDHHGDSSCRDRRADRWRTWVRVLGFDYGIRFSRLSGLAMSYREVSSRQQQDQQQHRTTGRGACDEGQGQKYSAHGEELLLGIHEMVLFWVDA
jgi:hypothetical protein